MLGALGSTNKDENRKFLLSSQGKQTGGFAQAPGFPPGKKQLLTTATS